MPHLTRMSEWRLRGNGRKQTSQRTLHPVWVIVVSSVALLSRGDDAGDHVIAWVVGLGRTLHQVQLDRRRTLGHVAARGVALLDQ